MSIRINQDVCIGCKKCLTTCPGSLIKLGENKKAFIKYPKDCWGCSSCMKECQSAAISFYLGADIGGRGSRMHTVIEGDIVHWKIEESNGVIHQIDINRKDSNQY